MQRREGDFTAARETLAEAHQTLITLGERDSLLYALAAEAELALWQAAPDAADALIAEAEQQLTQNPMSEARIATVRGELARQRASALATQWFERVICRKAHAMLGTGSDLDQLRWVVDTGAASESCLKRSPCERNSAPQAAHRCLRRDCWPSPFTKRWVKPKRRALLTVRPSKPRRLPRTAGGCVCSRRSHGDRRQRLDASAATAAEHQV